MRIAADPFVLVGSAGAMPSPTGFPIINSVQRYARRMVLISSGRCTRHAAMACGSCSTEVEGDGAKDYEALLSGHKRTTGLAPEDTNRKSEFSFVRTPSFIRCNGGPVSAA